MDNLFRKFVYTGVGFVSLTTERMAKQIEKLVGDGKISEDEGKKIVDDFMKNTETKKDELEGQFKSIIEKVVKSFSFATSGDVVKLENRVSVLEALLAKDVVTEAKEELKEEKEEVKEVAKKVVKKAAPKKIVAKKDDTKDEK